MITIQTLYFGPLRDALGRSSDTLQLPIGSTVEALWAHLPLPPGLPIAIAVNQNYADKKVVLQEGDEVALLPPVGGG